MTVWESDWAKKMLNRELSREVACLIEAVVILLGWRLRVEEISITSI